MLASKRRLATADESSRPPGFGQGGFHLWQSLPTEVATVQEATTYWHYVPER